MKCVPKTLAALTAAVCLFSGSALTASAYTAEDVAAKARNAGWPEYLIQAGLNEWSSGNYTQEDLDAAYASVEVYSEKSGELIANSFGVDFIFEEKPSVSDAPAGENAAAQQNTPDEAGNAAQENTPGEAGNAEQQVTPGQSGGSVNADVPSAVPADPQPLVVTKTDGSTEERIPKAEFIKMPIEEKKEYVASLTDESKQEFLNDLTTEERNSILKQLPAEQKAELIQSYIDAASDMGMNVSVDNIEDNNVSMTIRNNEGQIIGKTSVGSIIDETGISHTAEWMTALLAILISLLGFGLLYRYISRTE